MKINFLQLLTLIFITLKLTSVITWNWFWVLSPMAIPLGFAALCFILAVIVGGWNEAIKAIVEDLKK